jgi:hypothetical protein
MHPAGVLYLSNKGFPMISPNRSIYLALGALCWLGAPATAQLTKWSQNYDSVPANTQIVGIDNHQEWGPGAGALTSSTQAYSGSNSIAITGGSDLVREFAGRTSGQHTFTCMQYIPAGLTAKAYFILLSSYGATNKWAVQVAFNPTTKNVEADAGGATAGATTAIVFDKWIEVRCEIDLDQDWVQFYYNGTLLDDALVADHPTLGGGWKWSGGPGGTANGPKVIGAMDLFANNSSPVYYDDLELRRNTSWSDNFDWGTAKGSLLNDARNASTALPKRGWEGWTGTSPIPDTTFSAVGEGRNGSVALAIDTTLQPDPDIVHQYNITKGTWEYTAYQFLPTTFQSKCYFILMNDYGTTNSWMLQVAFNGASGNVEGDMGGAGGGATLPLAKGQWVQLRAIVMLDDDWMKFFYNGVELDDPLVADHPVYGGGLKITTGVFGGGTTPAPLALKAVDLYSNSSTRHYYDDLCLRQITPGLVAYGDSTVREGVSPTLFANSEPLGTNLLFGLDGSGPRNSTGILGLALGKFGNGVSLGGSWTLYIDPNPALVLLGITTDSTGYSGVGAPLLPTYVGLEVFAQEVWITGSGEAASNGLQIKVH